MQDTENYEVYRLFPAEVIRWGLPFIVLLFGISYVFYDTFWVAVLLLPVGTWGLLKFLRKRGVEKRKRMLRKSFMNALLLLSDYLRTGRSVESGISESVPELRELWGAESDIVREWQRIDAGFRYNKTVEELLADFGRRSNLPEVRDFAEVFRATKRGGGKLNKVLLRVVRTLSDRFYVDEKIETTLAAKKAEQKIMDVMPLAILGYLKLASPDLLSVMYTTAMGRVIMTVCLVAYGAAIWWADRITDIRM